VSPIDLISPPESLELCVDGGGVGTSGFDVSSHFYKG
jgi:hypothetical protein